MIHPHTGAKIYKKNDIGKKTGGKLSAEHGKYGIDEKTSVSLLPRGQWVCDKSREFRVRKNAPCKFVSPPLYLLCKYHINTIKIPYKYH